MDIDSLTDDDRKQLAKDLAAELDTGLYGNRAVLSRRQLFSLAGGSAGVAGLVALGVDPATAQSAAGQVGTQTSPEDVFAFNLDVQGALQRDLDAGGQAIENVGSVTTDAATIGAGNTINQVEFGREPLSTPSAPSDDTWGTQSVTDVDITFDTQFTNTPRVVATGNNPVSFMGNICVLNVDTSSFTIRFRRFNASSVSGAEASWIAFD